MKNLNIKNNNLIILGSGPAGYSASIYASRFNLKPILITGMNKGGQLIYTKKIENWPGDYKKLSGKKLMIKMNKHAKKFKTKIIFDTIYKVNLNIYPYILYGDNNVIYKCKSLIIATGTKPKYLKINLEKKYIGNGISTCAVCDGYFYKNKKVAIIGGGNTAIEEAIYLSNIVKKVNIIHRGNFFTSEKILINKLKKKSKEKKNIKIYKNCILKKILDKNNEIYKIKIKNIITNIEKKILIDGIFIAIGNIPNTEIFKKYLKLDKNKYIITNNNVKYKSSTNIPGIFAAGDVTSFNYKQAIIASAMGVVSSIDAEKFLNK